MTLETKSQPGTELDPLDCPFQSCRGDADGRRRLPKDANAIFEIESDCAKGRAFGQARFAHQEPGMFAGTAECAQQFVELGIGHIGNGGPNAGGRHDFSPLAERGLNLLAWREFLLFWPWATYLSKRCSAGL